MSKRSQYNTQQRAILLAYLESVQGTHVTVNDICRHFETTETPIGTTTIYRQLERLVTEGLVSKYRMEGTGAACFEYIGTQCHQPKCFHCKCESCGKLIHLQCEELSAIQAHIAQHHGFRWNTPKTVFYGVCEQCQTAE